MISNPRESFKAKYDREQKWHRWYAWRPVLAKWRNSDSFNVWVWREFVERKRIHFYNGGGTITNYTVYRTIKK